MNCKICHRNLDNDQDPQSLNCGGDCLGCMIIEENAVGDHELASGLALILIKKVRELEF